MRIVAVADTHCYEDDLAAIPDGDIFVHAGDLLQSGSVDELHRVVSWLRELPHRYKLVIAGNHDWCFARESALAQHLLAGVATYLQDSGTTIAGISFWGSPWQPEFCGWAFNLPRGPALRERWSHIPPRIDVLVTHGPPRGIGDLVGGHRAGCDDLLDAVQRLQPALHLFGHIHEDGGFWRDGVTAFANVTTDECTRAATVVDMDPHTKAIVPTFIPNKRAAGSSV
ncbi:MAG: hypothetical protein HOW73_09450 [Polyangiaceae bacterium]|nr:hypothetical protein [Polyangiaceae bacterium]